jgi:hypothetical protein
MARPINQAPVGESAPSRRVPGRQSACATANNPDYWAQALLGEPHVVLVLYEVDACIAALVDAADLCDQMERAAVGHPGVYRLDY